MKALARAVSALALVGIIGPPFLYLTGRTELGSVHGWMLAATVLWFAAAPFSMKEQKG